MEESMFKRITSRTWAFIVRAFDRITDIAEQDGSIIKREGDLFAGAALVLIGLMHFQSNRYCDGNSADYLSCTRPSSYYYYGGLEIILVLLGSFFILLWFIKRGHARRA